MSNDDGWPWFLLVFIQCVWVWYCSLAAAIIDNFSQPHHVVFTTLLLDYYTAAFMFFLLQIIGLLAKILGAKEM